MPDQTSICSFTQVATGKLFGNDCFGIEDNKSVNGNTFAIQFQDILIEM